MLGTPYQDTGRQHHPMPPGERDDGQSAILQPLTHAATSEKGNPQAKLYHLLGGLNAVQGHFHPPRDPSLSAHLIKKYKVGRAGVVEDQRFLGHLVNAGLATNRKGVTGMGNQDDLFIIKM